MIFEIATVIPKEKCNTLTFHGSLTSIRLKTVGHYAYGEESDIIQWSCFIDST